MTKNIKLTLVLLISFVLVFFIEYFCIVSYIEETFKYTNSQVRNDTLINEKLMFKNHLIEVLILMFFNGIGIFLCLNIGFLFLNIKIKLRDVFNIVLITFFINVFYELLLILLVKLNKWTLTIGSLEEMTNKLSILNYVTLHKDFLWIGLSLKSLNFLQLLVMLMLVFIIGKTIKVTIIKAFSLTVKTYGLGIMLWFFFAMVMEMNFS